MRGAAWRAVLSTWTQFDAIVVLECISWERGHPGRFRSGQDARAPRENHARIYVQVLRSPNMAYRPFSRLCAVEQTLILPFDWQSSSLAPPLYFTDGDRQALHQKPFDDLQQSSIAPKGVFWLLGVELRQSKVLDHGTRACLLAASRIARRPSHLTAYSNAEPPLVLGAKGTMRIRRRSVQCC